MDDPLTRKCQACEAVCLTSICPVCGLQAGEEPTDAHRQIAERRRHPPPPPDLSALHRRDREKHIEQSAKARKTIAGPRRRDPRLPVPGTILTATCKGEICRVLVTETDFQVLGSDDQVVVAYKSLSRAAVHFVKRPANGFAFFKLQLKGKEDDEQ